MIVCKIYDCSDEDDIYSLEINNKADDMNNSLTDICSLFRSKLKHGDLPKKEVSIIVGLAQEINKIFADNNVECMLYTTEM